MNSRAGSIKWEMHLLLSNANFFTVKKRQKTAKIETWLFYYYHQWNRMLTEREPEKWLPIICWKNIIRSVWKMCQLHRKFETGNTWWWLATFRSWISGSKSGFFFSVRRKCMGEKERKIPEICGGSRHFSFVTRLKTLLEFCLPYKLYRFKAHTWEGRERWPVKNWDAFARESSPWCDNHSFELGWSQKLYQDFPQPGEKVVN